MGRQRNLVNEEGIGSRTRSFLQVKLDRFLDANEEERRIGQDIAPKLEPIAFRIKVAPCPD